MTFGEKIIAFDQVLKSKNEMKIRGFIVLQEHGNHENQFVFAN